MNPVILVVLTLLIMYATYQLVAYSGALAASGCAARSSAIQPHLNQAAIPFYTVGAILGLALGVVRGRTIRIFWDATAGKVMQQGNAISLLIWVALFALRFGIEYLASKDLVGSLAAPISDVLLIMGTGSIIGRNLYLLLRYQRLSTGKALANSP